MTSRRLEVLSGSPSPDELRAAEMAVGLLAERVRLRARPSKWRLAGRKNATAAGFREQTARRNGRGDAK
ncbi:MAG TPA: hypothetical protein VND22_02405 [Actinomycetota bacterium]|nr:hypothetical protein [Actinomycetota bacterium]